jgi:hypothetical protein
MAYSVLADSVSVYVNDNPLPSGIVQSVSVETALDKEDLITLTVLNPFTGTSNNQTRTSQLRFIDATAFATGQHLEVRFIQQGEEVSLARGIIQEWLPVFPESGLATLTLKAYGGGILMMDGTPSVNAHDARAFSENMTISEVVSQVVNDYGFEPDVEMLFEVPQRPILKKAGMTDYAFLKGLANLVGLDFFIKWDQSLGKFRVTWKEGALTDPFSLDMIWGPDYDKSSGRAIPLLSFEPSFAINGNPSNVEVYYYDQDGGIWERVIYPAREENKEGKGSNELEWQNSALTGENVAPTSMEQDIASATESNSARGLRIKAGGFSVEVVLLKRGGSRGRGHSSWARGEYGGSTRSEQARFTTFKGSEQGSVGSGSLVRSITTIRKGSIR